MEMRIKGLIAIGASITANCQACLDYHVTKARESDAEENEIQEAIAKSSRYWGMQTFNQALCKYVQEGVILPEVALASSTNPGDLRLMLKGVGIGSAEIDNITKELLDPAEEEMAASAGSIDGAGGKKTPDRGFSF